MIQGEMAFKNFEWNWYYIEKIIFNYFYYNYSNVQQPETVFDEDSKKCFPTESCKTGVVPKEESSEGSLPKVVRDH